MEQWKTRRILAYTGFGQKLFDVIFSCKIRRKFAGSPTIIVLTDREELNTQISNMFESCGLLGRTEASEFIAVSGDDLIKKRKGNPSFIFTLIQKFHNKAAVPLYYENRGEKILDIRKWNLDIRPHREKMEKRELDKEFKDKDNHLRIVFVCAMWLTGFDVNCLSCLYLDKPLKAHTLMQTIARANRVEEGKSTDPTIDKSELIGRVLESIATAEQFLRVKGFLLKNLVSAKDFDKLALLQETKTEVDTLIGKILWEELPECYSGSEIFTYRQKIYEYVYRRYREVT